METKKLKIAWFSNLSTGSNSSEPITSYVTRTLYPYLKYEFDIQIFTNQPELGSYCNAKHYLTARSIHNQVPFDIFFYQLEDKPECQWQRILCATQPGLTYFHDFLFTSYGPEPILNSTWKKSVENFRRGFGEFPDLFDKQFQQGPHALREASLAGSLMFSQPAMLEEAQRIVSTKITEQPKFYLPTPVNTSFFKANKQVKRQVLLASSPWMQERVHTLFEAIMKYDSNMPIVWLLDRNELRPAQELATQYKLLNINYVIGRNVENWQKIISAGGVCAHLLFSVYGQTSPYLPLSLAQGLPCIVTRFANSEYLPDNLVYKVQAGESEVFEIQKVLSLVFDGHILPDSENVSGYALENYSAEIIAKELSLVFKNIAPELAELTKLWANYQQKARTALVEQAIKILPCDKKDFINTPHYKVYQEFGWI